MKDFSYQYTGTMEVVVEVSDCKYPHRSKVTFNWVTNCITCKMMRTMTSLKATSCTFSFKLLTEWDNNREAMLAFIEQAHTGVKGFVTEADGATPPRAAKGRHVEVRVRKADGPSGRYGAFERWIGC